MHCIKYAGILGWLVYLIVLTTAVATEIMTLPELPPAELDPRWVHRLPQATFVLPKSSDYREIPQPSREVETLITPSVIPPVIPPIIPTDSPTADVIPPTPLAATSTPLLAAEQPMVEKSIVEPLPLLPLPEKKSKKLSATHIETPPLMFTFWHVQIMEGNDREQLQKARASFIAQYRDLLQDDEPLMSMDETAEYFYLQLKSMPNEESAHNWCATLQQRGWNQCLVTQKTRKASLLGWQLQLAALHSLTGAKMLQQQLLARHGELLKNQHLIITLNESGEFFRLRLTTIPDKNNAQKLCAILKERGVTCFMTKDTLQKR